MENTAAVIAASMSPEMGVPQTLGLDAMDGFAADFAPTQAAVRRAFVLLQERSR